MKNKRPKQTTKALAVAVVALVVLGSMVLYVLVDTQSGSNQSEEVAGKTEQPSSHDAYAGIADEDIARFQSFGEFGWDTRDPYYGFNTLPIAAVVHIDSIDGGRTYSPISGHYVYPQTFGKMTVLTVYKGDVKPGQQLNYIRLGGIVSYDDYWNSLNPQQQDKRLHLNKGEKNPTGIKYVEQKFSGDVDIEAGKNYLVFLTPSASKDGSRVEYSINGVQYGLRKVQGTGSDMKVYNNDTKEWESLSNVVKLN